MRGTLRLNKIITQAYQRLLGHFGTKAELSDPSQFPAEAEMMNRAVQEASDPSVGTAYLRAALELAAVDQHNALSREINVVSRLRDRDVSWREIAQHRGLESAQAARQRYKRLTEAPEVAIFAFRDADEDGAPWHGEPHALDASDGQVGRIAAVQKELFGG